jgi:hypothetical protein
MKPISLSGPIRLEWQWEKSNPQFPKIGPEKTCDLGHLRRDDHFFKLKTIFHPNQYNFTVAKDERMVVGIVAQSNEVESNKLKLDISWDGIWSEDPDEMVKHMVIKPLPSVNPYGGKAKRIPPLALFHL